MGSSISTTPSSERCLTVKPLSLNTSSMRSVAGKHAGDEPGDAVFVGRRGEVEQHDRRDPAPLPGVGDHERHFGPRSRRCERTRRGRRSRRSGPVVATARSGRRSRRRWTSPPPSRGRPRRRSETRSSPARATCRKSSIAGRSSAPHRPDVQRRAVAQRDVHLVGAGDRARRRRSRWRSSGALPAERAAGTLGDPPRRDEPPPRASRRSAAAATAAT